MNILIPMGGVGSRFSKDGYRFPKPLVNIVGRPMIMWILDHLVVQPDDCLYVGVVGKLDDQFGLMQRLKQEYASRMRLEEVLLGFETRGAAETLFIMLQAIRPERLARRTISLDCDTIYWSNVLQQFRDIGDGLSASFYFEDHGGKPIFSYLLFEGESSASESQATTVSSSGKTETGRLHTLTPAAAVESGGRVGLSWSGATVGPPRVIDVREKIMISSHANTGAYAFASGAVLRDYCVRLLDESVGATGEYYTTNLIRQMVSDGQPFVGLHVDAADFVCVGTPDQLHAFLEDIKQQQMRANQMAPKPKPHEIAANASAATVATAAVTTLTKTPSSGCRSSGPAQRRMRFCFDLDNTLVSYPSVTGDYTSCMPKQRNIQLVRELYAAGHYIIIQTARRMKTHNGNVGAVIRDIGPITLNCLQEFGVPYHEIIFGKPYADVYVDDLAVHALIDTDKEVGWALGKESEPETMSVAGDAAAPLLSPTVGVTAAGPGAGVGAVQQLQSLKAKAGQPKGFITARHFNNLQEMENTVIKSALTSNIRGEVYFYQHIPASVSDLFPKLHRVDVGHSPIDGSEQSSVSQTASSSSSAPEGITSLVIDRVRGVTFSHLLTNHCLTEGRLTKLLAALHRLHSVSPAELDGSAVPLSELNLCANWADKVAVRFRQWNAGYAALDQALDVAITSETPGIAAMSKTIAAGAPSTVDIAAGLDRELREYESQRRFVASAVIHGDPVFSNVLLTSSSSVKLLDMRGCLGSITTTAGDQHYDLAKVLQSLYGYDFILLDLWPGQQPADSNAFAPKSGPSSKEGAAVLAAERFTHMQAYLDSLRNVFWSWLGERYPGLRQRDLKLLTCALFFSLIPLHVNKRHQMLFLMMARSLWTSL